MSKINDALSGSNSRKGPKLSNKGTRIETTNELVKSIDENKLKVLLNTSLSYKQFCHENGSDQFTCDP